jgi:hypothetical protein
LDVAGDRVLLDEDGSIAAVTLNLTAEWSYDLPEGVQPAEVVTEIAAGRADGELSVVASDTAPELFLESSGETTFDVDLLAEGVLSADSLAFEAGEQATDVLVEERFEVLNASGEPLATDSAEATATLAVERDGYTASEYGSVGGSGSLTIQVE